MRRTVTVENVGLLALVEDEGRGGLAHLGLGRSGAADRTSYALANRLVGNRTGAACIETTLGGLRIRLDSPALVAVTGAPAEVRCDDRLHGVNSSFWAPAGASISLGWPSAGLRSYLAIRGGIIGHDVLGSASWDTMAHLGTPPLQAGDVLELGESAGDLPGTDHAPIRLISGERLELPLILGPRDDWFTAEAIERLAESDFTVSSDTDRVGARLVGPELPRSRHDELASEGVVLGSLQVPRNGRPTLFLVDHPVTGGYPVIGVVPDRWVDLASQAAPGQVIRFRPTRSAP